MNINIDDCDTLTLRKILLSMVELPNTKELIRGLDDIELRIYALRHYGDVLIAPDIVKRTVIKPPRVEVFERYKPPPSKPASPKHRKIKQSVKWGAECTLQTLLLGKSYVTKCSVPCTDYMVVVTSEPAKVRRIIEKSGYKGEICIKS